MISLSIVMPCFNEGKVIRETHGRLTSVLEQISGFAYEVIYVDDGSVDDTLDILRDLQSSDQRVRVVSLSRNFGHQIAVTAGLRSALGDVVGIMDADLQDPPEVLPEMLERWHGGAEVVYGVRTVREGETAFKRWTSAIFYRFLASLSEISIPLDTGDFRLMDRKVVDAFLEMPERDRFVRGMVAWIGFRQEPVRYRRLARVAGESKYPFGKMLRTAVGAVLSFSPAPLRLMLWWGFAASGLALAGIAYALVVRLFTDAWVSGWALTFITILFFGGMQLAALGLIGEYLARIYAETKRRPLYLVKERLGFDSPEKSDQ